MTSAWGPGDRVAVHVPNRANRGRWEWRVGTVTEIDPGGRRCVRVDFDKPVNGCDHCTATHDELRACERADA